MAGGPAAQRACVSARPLDGRHARRALGAAVSAGAGRLRAGEYQFEKLQPFSSALAMAELLELAANPE